MPDIEGECSYRRTGSVRRINVSRVLVHNTPPCLGLHERDLLIQHVLHGPPRGDAGDVEQKVAERFPPARD